MLVDTHCHLNFPDAFPDVASTLARAKENGVNRFVVVGCDTETSQVAIDLSERHEGVYACVGWHPNYSQNFSHSEIDSIQKMTEHPKVVAIGEIGLDYHWQYATVEQQNICTEAHMQLAVETGLPVVFHCREAYPDLLSYLETRSALPVRMVLHCFGGDETDTKRAIDLNCWFGVDGPLTYKKAEALRNIVSTLPRDKVLLETDCPYLTPHPYRGKPNEPAMVPLINNQLAEIWGVSPDESAAITTSNAVTFFGW